jgi:uncharacterized membrane protein YphA (DoxX/SURF4 family)
MVAVLLRLGLGINLLNGGLIGYLAVRQGVTASGVSWSTILGPAAVAGALHNDLLVPVFQIAIGLALVLGFFTPIAAVLAGILVLAGPVFHFLAILSTSSLSSRSALSTQVMVSTGSMNQLLLVAAVLWLTPIDGTPWSLDYVIFAHRRPRPEPDPAPGADAGPLESPSPPGPQSGAGAEAPPGVLTATRGE